MMAESASPRGDRSLCTTLGADTDAAAVDQDLLAEAATRTARRRLLPLLVILYVCAHLDRSNVSFALRGGLDKDLSLSDAEYGFGSSAFHVGYTALQVPANVALEHVGPRRWFTALVFIWGVCSAATALATGAVSFAALRLLLGVAEAGYAPGVMFYLALWFAREERARVLSLLYLAGPVAGALGAPFSAVILGFMDGFLGVAGWRWIFIVQGAPVALFGALAVYRRVPDGPASATWLTPAAREALLRSLTAASPARARRRSGWAGVCVAAQDARTWLLVVLSGLPANITLYGCIMWLPSIVRDVIPAGSSGSADGSEMGRREHAAREAWVGLAAMVPYACAALGVAFVGRTPAVRRTLGVASPDSVLLVAALQWVGAASLCLVPFAAGGAPALVLLSFSAVFIWAWIPAFWALCSSALRSEGLAAGVAIVNTAAHVGAFLGPPLYGAVSDSHGRGAALRTLAVPGLACASLAAGLALCQKRRGWAPAHAVLADEWEMQETPVPVPGDEWAVVEPAAAGRLSPEQQSAEGSPGAEQPPAG
eukprot:TRINITY_DN17948_c0_g1_i2.p1 TRINITY_DN17948_c0_g1~~TRINITY_DN17948_c0_g1_i2.p1  ORF type:complete len:575 (+),score=157.01 TRINITY_DN17948_c0_g1_i2:107-1726(+)